MKERKTSDLYGKGAHLDEASLLPVVAMCAPAPAGAVALAAVAPWYASFLEWMPSRVSTRRGWSGPGCPAAEEGPGPAALGPGAVSKMAEKDVSGGDGNACIACIVWGGGRRACACASILPAIIEGERLFKGPEDEEGGSGGDEVDVVVLGVLVEEDKGVQYRFGSTASRAPNMFLWSAGGQAERPSQCAMMMVVVRHCYKEGSAASHE